MINFYFLLQSSYTLFDLLGSDLNSFLFTQLKEMDHDELDNDEWVTPKGRMEQEYVDKLTFKKFDPVKHIIGPKINTKNASITIIGKRRSGKSNLIRDLYHKLKSYYKTFYLCTNTYATNKDFWKFIDPRNIIIGIDEARLSKIIDEQTEAINKEKTREDAPYVCIIFDDIITSETGVRYSDFISSLYANGRQYNIMSILATQSLKKVSKHARDNTDITICYRMKNLEDRKAVVEENFEAPTPGIGLKILRKICTEPFQCVVCLNYADEGDVSTLRTYIADTNHKEQSTRPVKIKGKTEAIKTFNYLGYF